MKPQPHIKTEGSSNFQIGEIGTKITPNNYNPAYRTSLVKFEMRSCQILGCLSQSNFNVFSDFNGEFLKFRIRLKNLEIGS